MNYKAISDSGQVREKNEDNYTVISQQEGLDIIAVADGMGGHNAGEVASSLAIETVKKYNFKGQELTSELKNCIEEANQRIWQEAQNRADYQGMGTTLTLGIIKDRILTVGHVGDSRIYLYNNKEGLTQITDDHSYTGKLVRNNLITREEAAEHPKRNILTRALGISEEIEIDLERFNLTRGDFLLFCSDGVTEMLSDLEIEEILKEKGKLGDKVEDLVNKANQAGGHDNITIVIYQYS